MIEYCTPTELAERLAVSRGTLANWRVRGSGPPFIRVGRRIRYRREAVDEWLARREFSSTSDADTRGRSAEGGR